LRERLKRVIPRAAAGEWKDAARGMGVADLPLEQFLEPASKRQILARLLRNLKGIYRRKDSPERLLQVLNRMLVVAPEAAGERRDRGYVYQRLECWRPALQDLTEYLEREPDASDVHEVRASVVELSRRCARLN
jgi:regulator of sirC expression with transglutaminase-like and TPR domain